jgi:hypothetical protein
VQPRTNDAGQTSMAPVVEVGAVDANQRPPSPYTPVPDGASRRSFSQWEPCALPQRHLCPTRSPQDTHPTRRRDCQRRVNWAPSIVMVGHSYAQVHEHAPPGRAVIGYGRRQEHADPSVLRFPRPGTASGRRPRRTAGVCASIRACWAAPRRSTAGEGEPLAWSALEARADAVIAAGLVSPG